MSAPLRPVTPIGHARRTAVVPVALLADDELTRDSAAAYLATRRELTVIPAGEPTDADVLLMITQDVGTPALDRIESVVAARDGAPLRVVLVTETMREQHLWRAVSLGLISVVPRSAAGWERVVAAVLAGRSGRGEMPPVAVGWLLDQVRTLQSEVLDPAGLTAAGLSTREVGVLRLLADGLGTAEVAAELNYSERTIKNILHGMMTRLGLRNRSHAVAYALRAGAL